MTTALRAFLSVQYCVQTVIVCVDFIVRNREGCARAVISSHKRLRKTLITTQQAKGTTGENQGLWVGRIKVIEITRQPRRTL